MQTIDLRSDTVTRPVKGMLQSMLMAETGDDVFGEDPTVNHLENYCAEMFDKEAGLFVPSGTMANQIALQLHTKPMDEIICDEQSHIYHYENAGYAFHSRVAIKLIKGENGKIKAEQLQNRIQPEADWLPTTSLVCIENTCNRAGGSYYTAHETEEIYSFCKENNLKLHTDGARIFNAIVAGAGSPVQFGRNTDTLSFCFSKGLGAPVGSMLLGNKSEIKRARKLRKAMGGGMRQTGILAAGAMFALRHHIDRLKIDHLHAKMLAETLNGLPYIQKVYPVQTNIVVSKLKETNKLSFFLNLIKQNNILAVEFGEGIFRMVTHLDISEEMIEKAIQTLKTTKL